MIRAVENYDPDKGKDLEQHIFAQLQYEVLNCKDAAKLYGIKGAPYGARDLTVSLDALVETGVLRNDGWSEIEGFSDDFALDPKNPRVEVTIEEYEGGKQNGSKRKN